MCDENLQSDSDIETFSPRPKTHGYSQSNVNVLCNRYLYLEETYDTQKNMEGEEELMSEISQQDENTNCIDTYGEIQDFTEVLIGEVQKRPALYNIKSSIQSRSRVIVNQEILWQEIFEVFEGQIPVEELKRRWKIQRDRYMKIQSDMKKKPPSGSSAEAIKHPNYKYYELTSFLNDSMEQRKHVSNICLDRKSQPLTSSSNYNTSLLKTSHVDSPLSSCSTQVQPPLGSPTIDLSSSNTFSYSSSSSPLTSLESHKSSKRSRRSTTIEDELLRGLSTLKESTPPAATDSVDLFCRSIADTLRMLDMKSRLSVEMEIMQLLHDRL